jgi:hypothetical protein
MSHRSADGRRVNDRRGVERDRARGQGAATRNGSPRKPDGRREHQGYTPPDEANPGNVIDCGIVGGFRMGSELAHENEAPFSERLAEFFVRSWCPPGGLVIDPLCGSGTTGAVAVRWARRFLGCDVRAFQVALSRRRIATVTWGEALAAGCGS